MPLPQEDFAVVRLGGAVGSDRWSSGFAIDFEGVAAPPTQTEFDTLVAAVLSNFQTDVWGPGSNPLKGVNPSGVTLDTATGTYYAVGTAILHSVSTQTAVAGTASSGAYHAAACLVVSLLTAQSNRRTRGRMYLPTTSPNAAAANLQWAVSPPLAAQMKTYFDHINALAPSWVAGSTHRVAVVSKALQGFLTDVTRVRVDSIIDSQRGRSDKYVAAFSANSTLA